MRITRIVQWVVQYPLKNAAMNITCAVQQDLQDLYSVPNIDQMKGEPCYPHWQDLYAVRSNINWQNWRIKRHYTCHPSHPTFNSLLQKSQTDQFELFVSQSWRVMLLWAMFTAWTQGRECHHKRAKMLFHRNANSGFRCVSQILYAVSCFSSISKKRLLWIPCLGQTWDWIEWEHCHACRPEKVWQGHGKQGQALFYRIAQSWYTDSVLLNKNISIQPQYLCSLVCHALSSINCSGENFLLSVAHQFTHLF